MLRLAFLLVSFVVEACTADNPDYDPNFQPDAASPGPLDAAALPLGDMGVSQPVDQYIAPVDVAAASLVDEAAPSPDSAMGPEDLMAHQDQAMCVDQLVGFKASCQLAQIFNGSEFRLLFSATVPTFNRFQGGGGVEFWMTAGKCPADPRDVVLKGIRAGSVQEPLNANYSGAVRMSQSVNGVTVPDMRFAGLQCAVPHYLTQCGDSLNYQPMDIPSVEVNCQ